MMANPRRSSYSVSINNQGSDNNPFQSQSQSQSQSTISSLKFFLKKPHAFPFLLSVFLLLAWVSLRLQHSAHFSSSSPSSSSSTQLNRHQRSSTEDDLKANLVRFPTAYPSPITKDKRGWLLDPVSVAANAGISGGAVTCASVHVGEIRPRAMRGNHRHHTCNETFLVWGATTIIRVENNLDARGYAEVTVGADEVAVVASPSGKAHAMVNIDPVRSTFLMGCQDSIINYNTSSNNDFNVWKDL